MYYMFINWASNHDPDLSSLYNPGLDRRENTANSSVVSLLSLRVCMCIPAIVARQLHGSRSNEYTSNSTRIFVRVIFCAVHIVSAESKGKVVPLLY
jgi:hypothetical protein